MIQSNRLAIYAIGKIKKLWIRDGINQYKKRMPELIINELKTFNLNNLRSNNNIIICLSEEGKQFNSVELSSLALEIAAERKASAFVVKVFEGADFQEYRKAVIDEFGSVRTLSPEASRKQSSEVYLIAKRKRR